MRRRVWRGEGARLAYICHIFPHLTQTFVYREVEELRRAGVPLVVFSMKPPDLATLSEEARHLVEDTVYLPRVTGSAVVGSQLSWLVRSPRRYLRVLARVMRGRYRLYNSTSLWLHGIVDFARGAHLARYLISAGDFCHLHAQFADDACTTAMVAALLTGTPFSFRSHTSPNAQLMDEKVHRAQFIVSASLYDKRVLVHWCGEAVADKIYVNRLGVPLARYEPRGSTTGCQKAERDEIPLILSVGTLIPEKGFEYVIRACRILVDRGVALRCLIVGDGPDRAKLEALVTRLDLAEHVTLASYKPQEEVRELYREAAIFTLPCVFPLNGNVDVIPLVIQEAMAMERPVVSTPISGIPELIRNGENGLLAPEKDHEALADALGLILATPEMAQRLGRAARETIIQHFDVAVNAAALADILRREVPELNSEKRALVDTPQSIVSGKKP
jgi:colanic acid/amylovoran biosynthesis glycosyltransferase